MSIDRTARLIVLLGSVCPALVLMAIYADSANITISGQEQNVVYAIQAMLGGEALYRDPSRLPFVVTQYTPIYYDVIYAVLRWLGLQADNLRGIYLTGRLISAVATVGCSLTMVAILSRYSSLDLMTRFSLAFVLPLALGPWSCVARPDPLYLLFIVTSLLAAMRYAETLRLPMLIISATLLVLAYYTKQTAVGLFPLPLMIRFAREGWSGYRIRDILAVLMINAVGAVFMTQPMILNFTVGLGNGIDLPAAFREVYVPIVLYRLPLLLAAGLSYQQAARGADWRPRAIGLATLWYLVVGASLAVKYGSSENYLDEFELGCLLLIGMAPALARSAPASEQRSTTLVLLGLIIAGQTSTIYHNRQNLWSAMAPRQDFYEAGRALAMDPELQGKSIMMLDSSAAVFVPDRAAFVPIEVLGSSAASGHYDLAPVTLAVQDGQLCFAIADPALLQRLLSQAPRGEASDAWIPVIGRTLLEHFHADRRIGSRELLTSDTCRAGPH